LRHYERAKIFIGFVFNLAPTRQIFLRNNSLHKYFDFWNKEINFASAERIERWNLSTYGLAAYKCRRFIVIKKKLKLT